MRVLIACEFSGTVRDAFAAKGHDAWSCDLLPTESEGQHLQCDVFSLCGEFDLCGGKWDLMIAHPPCTYLTVSANGAFKGPNKLTKTGTKRGPWRKEEVEKSLAFFKALLNAPIPRIAVENPIGVANTRVRKPDQTIQPWMFGHGELKGTCLWLKGLPRLMPTHREDDLFLPQEPVERVARVHNMPPSKDRWKLRSLTFPGIAKAMAEQWNFKPK